MQIDIAKLLYISSLVEVRGIHWTQQESYSFCDFATNWGQSCKISVVSNSLMWHSASPRSRQWIRAPPHAGNHEYRRWRQRVNMFHLRLLPSLRLINPLVHRRRHTPGHVILSPQCHYSFLYRGSTSLPSFAPPPPRLVWIPSSHLS